MEENKKIRIVADSSANIQELSEVPFSVVPLHIIVGEQDFIDDGKTDIDAMQKALKDYKGKTSTACPGTEDWVQAFGDADIVFCAVITSTLSGAFNSANTAREMYEEQYPGRKVYMIDSLTTGPELALIVEKLSELILAGLEPEEIYGMIREYVKHTHLYFSLASLNNFAKNGRVNPLLAKGIGALGIRITGCASQEGTLQPMGKGRGDKKSLPMLIKYMEEAGYRNGKVLITHTNNPEGAEKLAERIRERFGCFNGRIEENLALCSYYAEPQSVLLAIEA